MAQSLWACNSVGCLNSEKKDTQQILNLFGADWDNCSYSSSLYSGKTGSQHTYSKKEIKLKSIKENCLKLLLIITWNCKASTLPVAI